MQGGKSPDASRGGDLAPIACFQSDIKKGIEQAAADSGGLVEAGLQPVAKCHQLLCFRDDAVRVPEWGPAKVPIGLS